MPGLQMKKSQGHLRQKRAISQEPSETRPITLNYAIGKGSLFIDRLLRNRKEKRQISIPKISGARE